ncbi:histidinol-phosphate transaminase [Peptoniphilus catoniae]|uniref:histidinol-phosphate transaminase n=1 Tax=Peptoniphilus catoniae TaxID=1660341 RepID=UPI0010FDE758|nr:histidinol-phosphate transaminase [Peptoniphilus catoniae]
MLKPRDEILKVAAYVPGKPIEYVKREFNLDYVVKLASNENPLGTSPKVIKALTDYIKNGVNFYPDGSSLNIRTKLAEKYKIGVENILITNGADDALGIIAQAYLNEGDEVLVSEYSFQRYTDNSSIMGAKVKLVPMDNFHFDLDKMFEGVNEKTKIIWLCNPNNPTGTMLEEDKVIEFIEKVPKDTLIVYDEAYREYVSSDKYPKDTVHFFQKYENVLTVKTFSKIYGLAGLRIGYVIGNKDIISALDKTRQPFNANALAQVAAIAALDDEDFIKKVYETNLEGKEYLYKVFEKLNLPYIKSEANHIFFESPGIDSKVLFEALEKEGVIVRPQKGSYTRLTVGTMEENKFFAEKLEKVLKELK